MKFDLNVHILEEITNVLIMEYMANPISKAIYDLIRYKRQSTKDKIIKGLWYNFVIYELPTKNNITFWGLHLNKIKVYDFIQGKLVYLNYRDKNIFSDFNNFIINISEYERITNLLQTEVNFKTYAKSGEDSFFYLHNIEKIQVLIKGNIAKKKSKKEKKVLRSEISELEILNKQLLDNRKNGFYTDIYKKVNVLRRKGFTVDNAIRSVLKQTDTKNIDINRLLKNHNNDIEYVIKYLHNTYYKSPYKNISK